jgi:CopA family copper-resistance protein
MNPELTGWTYWPSAATTVIFRPGIRTSKYDIAAAEAFDVIVEPAGQDAYTIFAQSIDRTGFAAGTLAVREGLRAPMPEPDRRQLLTHADMGMAHDLSAMAAAAADDPHAGHVMPGMPAPAAGASAAPQPHPDSEKGNPLVDGQAEQPMARLDDPGVGLRGNGRRVLTYADLRSLFDDPDGRDPNRTLELHLTGHMEKFAWSFDGLTFSDAAPLELKYGERMRIVLVNDTMMSHPIHLHGMWSDVENDAGEFQVRKHTVDMPPGTKRAYRVRADALGRWAYHCHLLLHMEAGMFREVKVVE